MVKLVALDVVGYAERGMATAGLDAGLFGHQAKVKAWLEMMLDIDRRDFSLAVFWPPGSGKTHLAVHLVASYAEANPGKLVALVAPPDRVLKLAAVLAARFALPGVGTKPRRRSLLHFRRDGSPIVVGVAVRGKSVLSRTSSAPGGLRWLLGIAGANVHVISKACLPDEATFRKYGLVVGDDAQTYENHARDMSEDTRRLVLLCDRPCIRMMSGGSWQQAELALSLAAERALSFTKMRLRPVAIKSRAAAAGYWQDWIAEVGRMLPTCVFCAIESSYCEELATAIILARIAMVGELGIIAGDLAFSQSVAKLEAAGGLAACLKKALDRSWSVFAEQVEQPHARQMLDQYPTVRREIESCRKTPQKPWAVTTCLWSMMGTLQALNQRVQRNRVTWAQRAVELVVAASDSGLFSAYLMVVDNFYQGALIKAALASDPRLASWLRCHWVKPKDSNTAIATLLDWRGRRAASATLKRLARSRATCGLGRVFRVGCASSGKGGLGQSILEFNKELIVIISERGLRLTEENRRRFRGMIGASSFLSLDSVRKDASCLRGIGMERPDDAIEFICGAECGTVEPCALQLLL